MYQLWYMLDLWGNNPNPEVPVRFYRTEAGGSPVLDWLRGLDTDDRRAVGLDPMRVQFGWPIGVHKENSVNADDLALARSGE
jgi:hypothetical protein